MHLTANKLTSLPDGPYLDRLECLGLSENDFTAIPQVRPELRLKGGKTVEGKRSLASSPTLR